MINRLSIIFVLLIVVSGCYSPIKGRVIDAETNQPIEGAIVLVEWTKKHGFGDHWTESFKVVERVSDKDGNVQIEGCNSPFVEFPDVTVYKKGYVAWSSRMIFPGDRSRTDFKWGDYTFKLEHFKPEYSYIDHTEFIRLSISASMNVKSKREIEKAYSWEDQLASKERDQKARKVQ
jgi:hypothetical protein